MGEYYRGIENDANHGIFERGSGHDLARQNVFLKEIAHNGADRCALVVLLLGLCREGGGAWDSHAEGFDGAGHRVGGVHLPRL